MSALGTMETRDLGGGNAAFDQLNYDGNSDEVTAERVAAMGLYELRALEAAVLRAHDEVTPVYFAQYGPDGLLKIGTSTDVRKRLKAIQANCPLRLRLLGWQPGGRQQELALHKQFVTSRAWGEWFNLTPDITQHLTEHALKSEPPVVEYPQKQLWHIRRRLWHPRGN